MVDNVQGARLQAGIPGATERPRYSVSRTPAAAVELTVLAIHQTLTRSAHGREDGPAERRCSHSCLRDPRAPDHPLDATAPIADVRFWPSLWE